MLEEGGWDVTAGVFVALAVGKAVSVAVGVFEAGTDVNVLEGATVGEPCTMAVGVSDGGTEVKVLVGALPVVGVLVRATLMVLVGV